METNNNFLNKIPDRTNYLKKMRVLGYYFLREQKLKYIKREKLNKLFLFFEFLIYHFGSRETFSENFLSSSVKLFFRLTQENLDKFFKKFKTDLEDDDKDSHEIKKFITGSDIRSIIFSLEETISKLSRKNDLPQVRSLLLILKTVSPGLLDFSLTSAINHLIMKKTKEIETSYFLETSFLEMLGLELFDLYFVLLNEEKKQRINQAFVETLGNFDLSEDALIKIKEHLSEIIKKETLILDEGFSWYLILKYYKEKKKNRMPKTWVKITKVLIIKLGSLFFSFIKHKKINDNDLFLQKSIRNIKTLEITKMIKFNLDFFEPFKIKNLPLFNLDQNRITGKKLKRVVLNLFSYGKIVKTFKSRTLSQNMEEIYIDKSNIANMNFLREQKYSINRKYGEAMFKAICNLSLETIPLFYEIDLNVIKENLTEYDYQRFIKLCLDPSFNIIVRNNSIIDTSIKQKPRVQKEIEDPSIYQKARNQLFLEIEGKKILLKSVLSEFLIMESFSKCNGGSGFYFPVFKDVRNRIYIGNNLLSPMSSSRFANFLKLDTGNQGNFLEKAQEIFEIIKTYENTFAKNLVDYQIDKKFLNNKDIYRKIVFENFREDNKEIINFIIKNKLENKDLTFEEFVKIFKNPKEIFENYDSFIECKKFLKDNHYCLTKFYCLDTASSGIQLSGLMLRSESLLKFSNITGYEKSQGYKEILENIKSVFILIQEFFSNKTEEIFFSYREDFLLFFRKLKKDFRWLKSFNVRDILFLVYCKINDKKTFENFFTLDIIKTLCIASIYGMTPNGFNFKIQESIQASFSENVFKQLCATFIEKERYFLPTINLSKKITSYYKELEEVNVIIRNVKIKIKKKYKNIAKKIQYILNVYLSFMLFSEKDKKDDSKIKNLDKKNKNNNNKNNNKNHKFFFIKGDIFSKEKQSKVNCEGFALRQRWFDIQKLLSKIFFKGVHKSILSDSFERMHPIFIKLVKIKQLADDQTPFVIKTSNYEFSVKYPESETKKTDVRKYAFSKNGFVFQKSRSQISFKIPTDKTDFNNLSKALTANFVQNADSFVLSKFLEKTRDLNVPTFCQHDKFGIPYSYCVFLRPILAECVLTLPENYLFNFCNANGLALRPILTESDLKIFLLQIKIRTLIYPEIFLDFYKDLRTEYKKIRENIKSDLKNEIEKDFKVYLDNLSVFLDKLLILDKTMEEFIKTFSYRKIFTNPYFIK